MEITQPIAAALPMAFVIGYPKNLNIGTFIIAPVIPIGAEIEPDIKPKIALGKKLNLGLILFEFSCCKSKYAPNMKTTIEKKRIKYFVFKIAAKKDPKNTPKITNDPKVFKTLKSTALCFL